MLSLVRGGPKVLVMESTGPKGLVEELEEFLTERSTVRSSDPLSAVESAFEEDTLVIFISSGEDPKLNVYSTPLPPEEVLCQIINLGLCKAMDNVCTAPGTAVMRLVGDIPKVIQRIANDLGGQVVDRLTTLACPVGARTIIYFTESPLNRPLRMEDLHSSAVSVERPCSEVLGHLKDNAMDYMSLAMGTPDWNQVDIKIYDADGRYDLHYRRLMGAIEGIDAGLVLSEAWGRDQAFILMSVPAYLVRLFTPLPPLEVKRLCMALEYSPSGKRWVDMDVIHNGKKVSWTVMKDHEGGRDLIGLDLRNHLLQSLSPQGLKRIRDAEEELSKGLSGS